MWIPLRCMLAAVAFCAAGILHAQNYTVELYANPEAATVLGPDCTGEATIADLLVGDFDVDGDGQVPPEELFSVLVLDENRGNGPLLDGCGTFSFIVTASTSVINFTPVSGTLTAAAEVGLDDIFTLEIPPAYLLRCEEVATAGLAPGEIPDPGVADLPLYVAEDGLAQLLPLGSGHLCNISLTYEDSRPVFSCSRSYTVVRTFTLRDDCAPTDIRTYTQTWRVEDTQAPVYTPATQDRDLDGVPDDGPLVFPTSVADACAARVALDMPGSTLTDDCDLSLTLRATIYSSEDLSNPLYPATRVVLTNGTREWSEPLPPGDYTFRYAYQDGCLNRGQTDVPVLVIDGEAPAARCLENTSVQLSFPNGGNGFTTLTPAAVDAGSSDACGEVALALALMEEGPDGNIQPVGGTDYSGALDLSCENVGTVRVGLRVTDEAGNAAVCLTNLDVRNAATLLCRAPANISLTCDDFAELALREDLQEESTDNLDAAFGAATGTGACFTEVNQSLQGSLDECGGGTLIRNFSVSGPDDLSSTNACSQVIRVVPVAAYTLRFPGDRVGACTEPADTALIQVGETGCDLIVTTVNTQRYPSPGPQCYDLVFTYRVLNLCEFDPAAAPIIIPRDFDSDGDTDEPTFLHLFPNDPTDPADDVARLDQDGTRNNPGFTAPLIDGYGTATGRGGFLYEQTVRIVDRVRPTILPETPPACFPLTGEDCTGDIEVNFRATDDCTPVAGLRIRAELDQGYTGSFRRTRFLLASEIISDGEGGYTLAVGGLPEGDHAVRVRILDECGNFRLRTIPVCVDNVVNAAPVCTPQVTVDLQPTGDGNATAPLFAATYIPTDVDFCGEEATYSIYTETEATQPGFVAGPGREALIFDCSSEATVPVRVYAYNLMGEGGGFCSVEAVVQRAAGVCSGQMEGTVAGAIFDQNGLAARDVEVTLAGAEEERVAFTGLSGRYAFLELLVGETFTVTPFSDDYSRHETGVTSADIVVIGDAILGSEPITNPYAMLAADVSNDQQLTVVDIILIRRFILGFDATYAANTAYRFVKADYVFPIPGNPWATTFPEFATLPNLPFETMDVDFIAIMIGDVNGNGFDTPRPVNVLAKSAPSLEARSAFPTPETVRIAVHPGGLAGVRGLQGTLEISDAAMVVDVLSGTLTEEQLNRTMLHERMLPFAYYGAEGLPSGLPLFTLELRLPSGELPEDVIRLTDTWTRREAVHKGGGISVPGLTVIRPPVVPELAVFPNPIVDRATVRYGAEDSAGARLSLYDAAGRRLWTRRIPSGAGTNQTTLNTTDFPHAGVYFLSLETGSGRTGRRIIVR